MVCIGKGSFAEVFLVEEIETGERYALKRISVVPPLKMKMLISEIQMLARSAHPNIVTFKEAYRYSDEICVHYSSQSNLRS